MEDNFPIEYGIFGGSIWCVPGVRMCQEGKDPFQACGDTRKGQESKSPLKW